MKLHKFKGIIFLLIMMLILGGGKMYFNNSIGPVNVDSTDLIMVQIPTGASTKQIAKILDTNNIINSDLTFRILSKLSKADGKMKAGNYNFEKSMAADEIIKILVNGDTVKDTVKVTIPEGFELKQIAKRLEDEGLVNKIRFIEIAESEDFDYKFLKHIPKEKNRLEGFLFPDTYEISKNATEKEIIKKMLNRFDDIFVDNYCKRAEELNMTVNDIVTLASIIEREAKVDKERPIVASVFYNRMNIKMPLQSCATVQYVLGKRKARLSTKDTEIDSPYNTYKHNGLPPKPIASPGKASIEAALYPSETDYLYFVVSKNGEHHFSKTYKEHLKAKNGIY
ncbi:endolytic transglycosylase MltG [Crassaminicella profunda]|uniref:endolytic transglycosylase MltG n=1 Tax=Crassaminicella profunda TaxID=1286698 RepID=UPI001CA7A1C1|nr:endolytic transglycosylase MltG [Crassaminicella profunda]QZY57002.1 endolytic transglycosylase MltG [Crassaminicella profunda]